MKKNISILVLFLCFFFSGLTIVKAASACPNSVKRDLSREANYVKANYEVIDRSEEKEITVDGNTTTYKVPNYSFEISIYNLTSNLYAEITVADGNEKRVYSQDTTDGVYTFVDNNVGDIYNYTIVIKSDGDCPGLALRTIKFTKPRYNAYSEFAYCQNSSSYYCQKFIGTEIDIKNTSEFLNKIQVNNDKNNPNKNHSEEENIVSVIKNNWKLYLIIFGIVAVIALIIIFIIHKKSKNKEWRL